MARRIATAGGAPAPDDADEAPPSVGLTWQATALLSMGRSVALSLSLGTATLGSAGAAKLSLTHCCAMLDVSTPPEGAAF